MAAARFVRFFRTSPLRAALALGVALTAATKALGSRRPSALVGAVLLLSLAVQPRHADSAGFWRGPISLVPATAIRGGSAPVRRFAGTVDLTADERFDVILEATSAEGPGPVFPDPPPIRITLEAEGGSGDGALMTRGAASGLTAVLLQDTESRILTFDAPRDSTLRLSVSYSNDNFGPTEQVSIWLDGTLQCVFLAQDTGDFGRGWNSFETDTCEDAVPVAAGTHQLTIEIAGGDGWGLELDVVELRQDVDSVSCGNGVVEAGEDCDLGATVSFSCCDANCRFLPTTV